MSKNELRLATLWWGNATAARGTSAIISANESARLREHIFKSVNRVSEFSSREKSYRRPVVVILSDVAALLPSSMERISLTFQ